MVGCDVNLCFSFTPLFVFRRPERLAMTTGMQEIAILEDKPLLTGQADGVKVTHMNTHTHTHAQPLNLHKDA